jgi:photosystem II stability/assembly factor-like uncharacterized protein
MKNIIFIMLLVFTSFTFAQDKYYKYINDCNYFEHTNLNQITNINNESFIWNYFQTTTTSQITDVQFIANLGWATHSGMGMVLTSNSGINWTSVSFNDTTFTTTFNGVYFINNLTGWVVGGALQIRKTTNGGLNWVRQVPPPIAGVLNNVFFLDVNTGFAIGRKTANYNSCILRTINGGLNWNEIIAATSSENELFGQYWFNSSTGWICGKSFLKKTTDGGLNYTDYYASVPPTSNGINALLCINFINNQTGWIGGSNLDHQNIYKTTNGGLNWIFQNNPVAQFTYSQINSIKFIDANLGWAAHGTPSSGAIMVTTNGGANWTIENSTSTWFDCLCTYNDAVIYCGAAGGVIWYSSIPSSVKKINKEIPNNFSLSQNYPNPFNPFTNIKFEIVNSEDVSLIIYDITGKKVVVLVNEKLQAGTYEINWDATEFSSGIYFYKMEAGGFAQIKKMILIK